MTDFVIILLPLACLAYTVGVIVWFRNAIHEAENDPIDFDKLKLKNYGKV
jgi:hypothetical protein